MTLLKVKTPLLAARTEKPLTPAQRAVVWEICAILDERRIEPGEDAVWLEVESSRLRNPDGRSDNVWLRECLERLLGVKFSGQDGESSWGAVLLAEYRIDRDVTRLMLAPRSISALRLPATFAKIDAAVMYQLPKNARTLYGLIADKFRQKKASWTVSVGNLKGALGLDETQYTDFFNFRRRVLDPSVKAISETGVCKLTWEPVKLGRTTAEIRFVWKLKQPAEAEKTAKENERHSKAKSKGKTQKNADAPPLIVLNQALRFLEGEPLAVRAKWAKRAVELGAPELPAMPAKENIPKWVRWVATEMAAQGVIPKG